MESSTNPQQQGVIESGLLAAIEGNAEHLAAVTSSGLTADDFIVYRSVYQFIRDHVSQYQSLPTPDQLATVSENGWNPPKGEFRYWLDQMVQRTTARKAQAAIRESLNHLETDPFSAIKELSNKLGQIVIDTSENSIQATDSTAQGRYEKFLLRAELFRQAEGRHIYGIRTGFHLIDSTNQGWMPGEMIGLFARPTVGKTWMLIREGVLAWLNPNNRVLLISPEMTASQIALRVDAMMAGSLNIPFSHSKVFSGDPTIGPAYKQLAEAISQQERWITIDSIGDHAIGVSDVAALHRQFKPSIILIDGISLLRDESNKQSTWEQIKSIAYGLKNFGTAAKVPVIVTHQAVNSARGRRGTGETIGGRGDDFIMPSLNDAAFGDAFVQACSTVVTMCADKDEGMLRWYSLRKIRERNITENPPRMALRWDVDRGIIEDLGHLGADLNAIRQYLGRAMKG